MKVEPESEKKIKSEQYSGNSRNGTYGSLPVRDAWGAHYSSAVSGDWTRAFFPGTTSECPPYPLFNHAQYTPSKCRAMQGFQGSTTPTVITLNGTWLRNSAVYQVIIEFRLSLGAYIV